MRFPRSEIAYQFSHIHNFPADRKSDNRAIAHLPNALPLARILLRCHLSLARDVGSMRSAVSPPSSITILETSSLHDREETEIRARTATRDVFRRSFYRNDHSRGIH